MGIWEILAAPFRKWGHGKAPLRKIVVDFDGNKLQLHDESKEDVVVDLNELVEIRFLFSETPVFPVVGLELRLIGGGVTVTDDLTKGFDGLLEYLEARCIFTRGEFYKYEEQGKTDVVVWQRRPVKY